MSLPVPPSINKGQIALDPINGIVYYKDDNENLVATTWSWLRDDMSAVSTDDDVTITGNLTVSGTTVSVNVETVTVADNILILNSNVTGVPTENAGLEVERGTSTNVSIRWNESTDKWQFTNDGSTYLDLSSIIENSVTLGLHTIGDYTKNLVAGTGVTISNNSGEGATPNISIDTSIVQTRVADISDTEIGYLNGVTSAIQTQINSKAPTSGPTFTGTTTLPSTTSIGNVSDTEIGYLDGVTSGVQAQLDSKQPTFTGYDYEIHVSQVDGNDTTGNGDLLTPVASITKALTLVTSQRKTVIIHPGTYTESPSITTQYTTLTGPGLIGGNIVISGTVSTNTGCTISGIKMTNLTVSTPTAQGNVNILNCEVSGTFTKSSNADYTVARLCDFGAVSITGAGLFAIFGGNPNFVTVNNASANVIVKSAVAVAPVLTAGTLSLVDSIIPAAVTNAVTSAASSVITLANCQFLTSALNNVAPVVLNGFYSILNCVYDKLSSTLAATSGTGGTANSIDYFQYINAEKFITQGGTSGQFVKGDGSLDSVAYAPLAALDLKANSATPTFTGMATIPKITVGGIEIDTTSPADTNVLKYSSSLNKYIPGVATVVAAVDDLTDVVAPAPSSDQVLAWDVATSKWINKTFSATVAGLDNIGDVTAPSPSSGDYLKWNGTAWVNDAISLDELSDTTVPSPSSGDYLKWDGSAWVNDPINLGTDTVGNYLSDVTAGTGVSVTHTPGEGSSAQVAIGQAVATSDSPTFAGISLTGTTSLQQSLEKTTAGGNLTGTTNIDLLTSAIYTYTSTGDFTFNFRGNSSTSLNSLMSTNQSITTVLFIANTTARSLSGINIDGTSQTIKWFGGSTPSGNASATDVYTITIIKTGSATYTVYASQSKFA